MRKSSDVIPSVKTAVHQQLPEYRAFRRGAFLWSRLDGLTGDKYPRRNLIPHLVSDLLTTRRYEKSRCCASGNLAQHFFFGISGCSNHDAAAAGEQERYGGHCSGRVLLAYGGRSESGRSTTLRWRSTLCLCLANVNAAPTAVASSFIIFRVISRTHTHGSRWSSPCWALFSIFAWSLATEEQFCPFWPVTPKAFEGLVGVCRDVWIDRPARGRRIWLAGTKVLSGNIARQDYRIGCDPHLPLERC